MKVHPALKRLAVLPLAIACLWAPPAFPDPAPEAPKPRATDNKPPGCTIGIQLAEEDEEDRPGVLVGMAVPGGPAQKAGLLAKDRIVSVDGKGTADVHDLYQVLDGLKEGQAVKIGLLRAEGGEERRLELEVTLGPPPPRSAYNMQFAFREPLVLEGAPPAEARIEAAARRGVAFVLSQQWEDGSWRRLRRSQVPDPKDLQGFLFSAKQSISPWAMTALCCMALRESERADPERTAAAVEKGVSYLLENTPERKRGDYAAWSWLLCVDCLCGEHARAADPARRDRIRREVKRLVALLLQDASMGQRLTRRYAPGDPEDPPPAAKEDPPRPKPTSRRGGPIPDEGGWAYYGWTESVSFMTADVLLALQKARAIGVAVPQGAIERAARYLESVRVKGTGRSDEGKEWYCYRGGALENRGMGRLEGGMGRIAVCERALVRCGKRTPKDLAAALGLFLAHRGELDRVRGYPGNHAARSFQNAAYYFYYAHCHAAAAAADLEDGDLARRVRTAVQETVLSTQDEDGTWTDHRAWGKLYGTAQALRALGEARREPGAPAPAPAASDPLRECVDVLSRATIFPQPPSRGPAPRAARPRPGVREGFEAIERLSKLDRRAAEAALVEALSEARGERYFLIQALGRTGGESAVAALRKLASEWSRELAMGQEEQEDVMAAAFLYRLGERERFEEVLRLVDRSFQGEEYLGSTLGEHFYNTACYNALAGRGDEALADLRRAFEDLSRAAKADPRAKQAFAGLVSHARQDPDLHDLWASPAFEAVLAPAGDPAEAPAPPPAK